jgi:circadian clock protein KaiC
MTAKRVPTGMNMLDGIIGGGFRQGKNYLLSGEAGTGKTIFGLQFLVKGFELGESGVYVTVDEKPSDVIEDANSFGFDLEERIEQNNLLILDYSSHFDQLRDKSKEIDVRKIVGDLNKYLKEINAKRLVIDPIAPFIVKDETIWEIRRYIRALFYSLDSLDCTSVLTSAIPTGTNQLSQYGIEEFYASGVILLSIRQLEKMHYRRILFVRKMRGTPYELEPYVFDFEYGKGIVIQRKLSEEYVF